MNIHTIKSFSKNHFPDVSSPEIDARLRTLGFKKTVQKTDFLHSFWKPVEAALAALHEFEGETNFSEIVYSVVRTGKHFGQKITVYYRD